MSITSRRFLRILTEDSVVIFIEVQELVLELSESAELNKGLLVVVTIFF
jgi:hypothetical protein